MKKLLFAAALVLTMAFSLGDGYSKDCVPAKSGVELYVQSSNAP